MLLKSWIGSLNPPAASLASESGKQRFGMVWISLEACTNEANKINQASLYSGIWECALLVPVLQLLVAKQNVSRDTEPMAEPPYGACSWSACRSTVSLLSASLAAGLRFHNLQNVVPHIVYKFCTMSQAAGPSGSPPCLRSSSGISFCKTENKVTL